MKKALRSKEMRSLLFMLVALAMAIMLCVSSIRQYNLFSVVVSIFMLATLSVGLGYQYCKHEDTISAIASVERKPKEHKPIKEAIVGKMPEDEIIAKIVEKSQSVAPEKKEVGLLEKYSTNN